MARMRNFSGKFTSSLTFALLVTALALPGLCLAGRAAHAQAGPVMYAVPGWPLGFGGDLAEGQSINSYENFTGFDGSDARSGGFSSMRYNFPNGWFVGSEGGPMALGLNGFSQTSAFGPSLSYQGVQFGYNFKNNGGLPLTVFGGFDTLKYNNGIGGPFAPFDNLSSTSPGYSAHAGFEYQPTPNVSLSLGFGYTQQSGRIDSDIHSLALPGSSSFVVGPR
jgi:opacity protein-like surface antigen